MTNRELFDEILDEGGPKHIAKAVGRTVSCCYRWSRDPVVGTGSKGLLDWFEAVIVRLGAVPTARPTLRKLELWTQAQFRRALGRPVGDFSGDLKPKAIHSLRRAADPIEECSREEVDCARAIGICLETQEQLSRVAAALYAMEEQKNRRGQPATGGAGRWSRAVTEAQPALR